MRTLYRAGGVYAPARPDADALVVDGGTIAWIGPAAAAPRDGVDRTVDLTADLGDDVLLAPAFVDAHVHVTETGLLLRGVDLRSARSSAGILDAVAAAARRGDDPILGHGWDETLLAEGRPPTSAELARAAGDVCVYLARVDVHSAIISPRLAHACGAARLDGWDSSGRVEREAHHAARAYARAALSADSRRAAQVAALEAAAAAGICAVHEMSAPHIGPDDDLRDLVALAGDPGTSLPEVVAYHGELVADAEEARAVAARLDVPLAGLAGDLCADGSIGSRTAAFREDYADAPGHRGHLYLSPEQIRDHVVACTRAGLQAGFHVIGDAAVDAARRGIRRAAGVVGIAAVRAARHRLEHVESLDTEGVADLADLGVVASVQPAFDATWGGPGGLYSTRLGPDRAGSMNPFGLLAARRVAIAVGSDSPVTPFDPWGAVRACLRHHAPDQRLDAAAAFAAHTEGGWWASRRDGTGTLAVGSRATFAAWSLAEPVAPPGGLPTVDDDRPLPRCRLTVVRGRTIHQQ